ncbi:hypothetical protein BAE44_0013737 [Dichanthelium oligosanthes]|uniref:Uncharacterized protein n=1 Tax=Dichanthelium oligosanthes TaxID=888268 RepID=A0A1E5VJF4_9POAL|nr:hypothetical protein BAE44_0013737 [Dichanthelium oligosanthes]
MAASAAARPKRRLGGGKNWALLCRDRRRARHHSRLGHRRRQAWISPTRSTSP